jgi:hypothetical protein
MSKNELFKVQTLQILDICVRVNCCVKKGTTPLCNAPSRGVRYVIAPECAPSRTSLSFDINSEANHNASTPGIGVDSGKALPRATLLRLTAWRSVAKVVVADVDLVLAGTAHGTEPPATSKELIGAALS